MDVLHDFRDTQYGFDDAMTWHVDIYTCILYDNSYDGFYPGFTGFHPSYTVMVWT